MWPAARHYAVEPFSDTAAALSPEEKSRVFGGESCEWAEWVTPENIDSHIWPRNAVVAERLWSPQNVTDVASMYSRLNAVSLDREALGLTISLRPHAHVASHGGRRHITPLRVFADVVEPVKDYNRWDDSKGPIHFHAPLTHMIDAVYPESDTARLFANLVQTYIASGYQDQDAEKQIRMWLVLWSNNDSHLHPLLETSFLLQEDEPISANLSAVASAGLQALDYLDKSQTAPDLWRFDQKSFIDNAKMPSAGLLLMVASPVQQLVDASYARH